MEEDESNNSMSKVIATIAPPTKKIGFPSNCHLDYTENVLTMTDDTTKRTFQQKAQFDAIDPNFESILSHIPETGKFRVVSFCSEYSILTTDTIKKCCYKLCLARFPEGMQSSQFISIGFVYDNTVRDFLSLNDEDSQLFELIETFDNSEMIDLLECGLEKLRRIKDSVFVLRIGTEDSFFEWVIVPKTDSYVPSPSMAGLPPNEKLFYVLNLLGTVNDQAIERFQRSSSIFRLISDSFIDVPTFWVFHIAEDCTMKSNATLCKVASILLKIKSNRINCQNYDMFYVNDHPNMAMSSETSDEYLRSLSQDEIEDLDYLRAKIGGEAFANSSRKSYGKDVSQSSAKNSYQINSEEVVEEEEEYNDYEYEDQITRSPNGTILRKPKRKNRKPRKKKHANKEDSPTKSTDEIRAEEDERRRKEEEEEDERRKTIELLRQSHIHKKDDSPKSSPKRKSKTVKSAKSIMESSQYSKMSRRDKVSERIAKLKQLRALEEEEEEEEEDDASELRELKKDKKLTAEERYMKEMKLRLKNRQNKFTKISILVNKAQRASKDRNVSIEKLEDLQKQVTEALQEAEQFRDEAKDEITYLRDTLAYKRQKHAQNQQDIQDIRHDYLERHCENVLETDKRKRKKAKLEAEQLMKEKEEKRGMKVDKDGNEDAINKKKKERKISIKNRNPEYEMAIKYLEEEIEKVRVDISILKNRPNLTEA